MADAGNVPNHLTYNYVIAYMRVARKTEGAKQISYSEGGSGQFWHEICSQIDDRSNVETFLPKDLLFVLRPKD